jgi:hypothetical protein
VSVVAPCVALCAWRRVWQTALVAEMEEHAKAKAIATNRQSLKETSVFGRGSLVSTIFGGRGSMAMAGGVPAGVVTQNKWVQHVSSRAFHVSLGLLLLFSPLWAFTLIFLMNPFLATCIADGGMPYANSSTTACYLDSSTGGGTQLVSGCRSWAATSDAMGGGLNWVSSLEGTGWLPKSIVLSGSSQTCFRIPGGFDVFIFWLFVLAELISLCSVAVRRAEHTDTHADPPHARRAHTHADPPDPALPALPR